MKRILDIIECDPIVEDLKVKKNYSKNTALQAKQAEIKIALIEEFLSNFKPGSEGEKFLARIITYKIFVILNTNQKQVDICKSQKISRQGIIDAKKRESAAVQKYENQHKLHLIKQLLTIDKLK